MAICEESRNMPNPSGPLDSFRAETVDCILNQFAVWTIAGNQELNWQSPPRRFFDRCDEQRHALDIHQAADPANSQHPLAQFRHRQAQFLFEIQTIWYDPDF